MSRRIVICLSRTRPWSRCLTFALSLNVAQRNCSLLLELELLQLSLRSFLRPTDFENLFFFKVFVISAPLFSCASNLHFGKWLHGATWSFFSFPLLSSSLFGMRCRRQEFQQHVLCNQRYVSNWLGSSWRPSACLC